MINDVKKKCLNCGYVRQPEDESEFIPVSECPKCHAIYEKVEKWLNEKEREEQRLKEGRQSREEKGLDSKSSTGDSEKSRVSKPVNAKIFKIAILIFVIILTGFSYVYVNNNLLERDLDGEIFIVTKGGANIRLALVEVRIITKETVIEFVKLKQKEDERERQRLKTEANNAMSEIETENGPFNKELKSIGALVPLKAKLAYLESDKFFFEGIPQGIFKTKTDIDGKFTLRVKRGSPGVLFAHGSRLVGGETEEYYWLLPIKLAVKSSTKISLNNENLFRNALHNFQFKD